MFAAGFVGAFYGSTVGGMGLISFTTLTLLGLPLPVAIATHRFSVLFLDIASTVTFYFHKKMFLGISLLLGAILSIGAYFGANFMTSFPKEKLNYVVAVILTLAFLFVIFSKKIAKPKEAFRKKYYFFLVPLLLLLGVYAGFFGVASGAVFMFIPVIMGYTWLESAAILRICGIMISVVASYVFIRQGLVDYWTAFPVSLGAIFGSWLGISFAIKKGDGYIRLLMGVVVVASLVELLIPR